MCRDSVDEQVNIQLCVCAFLQSYLKTFQLFLQLSAVLLIPLSQLPLFLSLCCLLLCLRLHLIMDAHITTPVMKMYIIHYLLFTWQEQNLFIYAKQPKTAALTQKHAQHKHLNHSLNYCTDTQD